MLDDDVKKCELVWVFCRALFDCLLFRFRPPPLGNIIHGCNEERKQARKQEGKHVAGRRGLLGGDFFYFVIRKLLLFFFLFFSFLSSCSFVVTMVKLSSQQPQEQPADHPQNEGCTGWNVFKFEVLFLWLSFVVLFLPLSPSSLVCSCFWFFAFCCFFLCAGACSHQDIRAG